MRISPPLAVGYDDETTLREWIRSGSAADVRRARIVLLAGAGWGPTVIAEELGCAKQTVITWRERYRTDGLPGLRDAPRSGRPATVDAAAVVRRTLEGPGAESVRWSTRTLAGELGISNVAVANIWRVWGIVPGAGGRVRLATEPALDAPVEALVGLHLAPPVRVLAVLVGPGGTGRTAVRPVRERSGLGPRLDEVGVGGGSGDPATPAAFVEQLTSDVDAGRLRLLADRPVEGSRPGVPLHRVASCVRFGCLVRVAGLLAGASESGATSVAELAAALERHPEDVPFSWISAVAINMQQVSGN